MTTRNEHTGDSLKTKIGSQEERKKYEDNWDRIFGKKTEVKSQKDPLCKICGKELDTVTECAWSACPKLWGE